MKNEKNIIVTTPGLGGPGPPPPAEGGGEYIGENWGDAVFPELFRPGIISGPGAAPGPRGPGGPPWPPKGAIPVPPVPS